MPDGPVTITGDVISHMPTITIDNDLVGKIIVRVYGEPGAKAFEGAWVEITATPSFTIVELFANDVRMQGGHGRFWFTMPDSNVTITGEVVPAAQFDEYTAEIEFDVTGSLKFNTNGTITIEMFGMADTISFQQVNENEFTLTIDYGYGEVEVLTVVRDGNTVKFTIEFFVEGYLEYMDIYEFFWCAENNHYAMVPFTVTEVYAIRLFEDESFQLLVEGYMVVGPQPPGGGSGDPIGGGDDFFPIVSGTYVISGTTITFTFPIYCDDTGNEIGVGTMIGTIGGNNIIIDLALPANEAAANALGFPPIVITFAKQA